MKLIFNKKILLVSIFLITSTLVDIRILPGTFFSISDLLLLPLFIIFLRSEGEKQNLFSILYLLLSINSILVSLLMNRPIYYPTLIASLSMGIIISNIFSKLISRINPFDLNKITDYIIITLSFSVILDIFFINLTGSVINISGAYGIDCRSFAGYNIFKSIEIIRPCGFYPEPGNIASTLAIFLSLKIYITNTYFKHVKFFDNFIMVCAIISIALIRSTQGALYLAIITLFYIYNILYKMNLIKMIYLLKLPNPKKYISFKFFITLFISSYAVYRVIPRILRNIYKFNVNLDYNIFQSIDLTRAEAFKTIFDNNVVHILFGHGFNKPEILVESLSQFISLYYYLGIGSFILILLLFLPTIRNSLYLFLFIFTLFMSKYGITSIPFWIGINYSIFEVKKLKGSNLLKQHLNY